MGWFPRAWGAILPLRWYIQILFDQAARGAPLHQTAEPFAYPLRHYRRSFGRWSGCAVRALARTGFAAPDEAGAAGPPGVRRRRRLRRRSGAACSAIAASSACSFSRPCSTRSSIRSHTWARLFATFRSRSSTRTIRDLSRGLIQALGAHGNLSIALRATTFAEAEDAIQARRAFGIVGIPPDTERNVLKGVSARLPIYGDSTYFILFNRTLQGILESVQAVVIDAVTASARRNGAGVQAATAATAPVDLVHGAAVQPDRLLLQPTSCRPPSC